ncbi:MAG TPA: DUF1573 domain-containing protein [Desulfuromonadales bacterium]|nr:DUF1573 domain-containing protein [Desulfuromonadales bacterium]
MKTIFLGFLSVFLLLLPAEAPAGGPKLVAADADFSFGQVFQGTKVEHTFRFRNNGEAPLAVEKVRSSCGCTAALLSATSIPPGGTGEIRTTFDSARFRGAVVKTVYLYVNDPAQPVAQFHLRGTVMPELVLEPEQVELGKLTPGTETEARAILTNQGEQEITLSPPETTSSELNAELAAMQLPPGKSVQLIVKALPREGKARLSGYVMIKTSSPRVPMLRLPVYGNVGENSPGR